MLAFLPTKMNTLEMNSQQGYLALATLLFFIVAPPEASQLGFALLGAIVYAATQVWSPRPLQKTVKKMEHVTTYTPSVRVASQPSTPASSTTKPWVARARPSELVRASHPKPVQRGIVPEIYQPSVMPVVATEFASVGWEAQVGELVSQITPGPDEDMIVQSVALHVKQSLQALIPEVEVKGLAQGSLSCGKAFGVAVPELDIVVTVNPMSLASRLQHRAPIDEGKLTKCALRACTDQLVSNGGFKFRRSAFQGDEPRVTMLVPASLGFFADSIPVAFSVNSVTPLHHSALLARCCQIEPRTKALVLFVKRWAKDRGICHAAQGHLSPYLWSLLVIYFMQVAVEKEGSLLPALEASGDEITLKRDPLVKAIAPVEPVEGSTKLSIGELFFEFVGFYTKRFNWQHEAVSIGLGQRAPAHHSMPLHIIPGEGSSKSQVGPSIQDPLKAGSNLGSCMNVLSLARLHAELARAGELCVDGASLTELLEPWAPPQSDSSPSVAGSTTPRPESRPNGNLCIGTPPKVKPNSRMNVNTPPKLDRQSNSGRFNMEGSSTPPKPDRQPSSGRFNMEVRTPPKLDRRFNAGISAPPGLSGPPQPLGFRAPPGLGAPPGLRAPPGLGAPPGLECHSEVRVCKVESYKPGLVTSYGYAGA